MGFYKSIGIKHFEDLENYIKTKGWIEQGDDFDPIDEAGSFLWYSSPETYFKDYNDLNVVWTIKKDGNRWFIRETATIRGGRSYNGIDITEEIVDMYNAMLANKPISINIERNLDYDTQANRGKICTGTLKLKTTVKIFEPRKEDDTNKLPWYHIVNAREENILLEHEFISKINFKKKAYSMESESEIRDKHQQWTYASRYGSTACSHYGRR